MADLIYSATGIIGTSGNDSLSGYNVKGLDGNDFIELSFASSGTSIHAFANGNQGDDIIHLNSTYADFVAANRFGPSYYNSQLLGGQGNDSIYGGFGGDVIGGGQGNDLLLSGFGNDTVRGGQGNDKINAGDGNDSVIGGLGDDTILVNTDQQVDTIYGNEGEDTFIAFNFSDGLYFGQDIVDIIKDFNTSEDTLQIVDFPSNGASTASNLSEMLANHQIYESNGSIFIELNSNLTIMLENTTLSSIQADTFEFLTKEEFVAG